jgi:hypothetical protein
MAVTNKKIAKFTPARHCSSSMPLQHTHAQIQPYTACPRKEKYGLIYTAATGHPGWLVNLFPRINEIPDLPQKSEKKAQM